MPITRAVAAGTIRRPEVWGNAFDGGNVSCCGAVVECQLDVEVVAEPVAVVMPVAVLLSIHRKFHLVKV